MFDQGLHPICHWQLTLTFIPSSLVWSSELPHLLYATTKLGARRVTLSLLQGQLFPSPLLVSLLRQVVLWASSYYLNNSAFCWIYKVYLQLRLLINLWGNPVYQLSTFWFAAGYGLLGMNLSSLQRSTAELYRYWLPWLSILQAGGNVKIRNKLLKICEVKLWIIFSIIKLENRTNET